MSEEKKHEPSEKRLEDSRKKGQVGLSKDIDKLLATLVVFETIFMMEGWARHIFLGIIDHLMQELGRNTEFWTHLRAMGMELLLFFAGITLVTVFLSALFHVLGVWMQIGILFAPEALVPKFEKFNPFTNLKQMFAGKSLSDFAINVVKMVVIFYIVYKAVYAVLNVLVLLPTGTIDGTYHAAIEIVKSIVRKTMILFIPIAAIDFGVQRYFYMKNLRMSDKEMMDEYKEMEGDPHVKGERKQFAHDIVFGDDPVPASENADAVVINPEHYAIALSYNIKKFPLPIVLAKAYDDDAKRLIEVAKRKNIPVIRYVWLARTLYAEGTAQKRIPKSTLQAVAMVYRLIKQMREHHVPLDEIQSVNDDLMYKNAADIAKVAKIG